MAVLWRTRREHLSRFRRQEAAQTRHARALACINKLSERLINVEKVERASAMKVSK